MILERDRPFFNIHRLGSATQGANFLGRPFDLVPFKAETVQMSGFFFMGRAFFSRRLFIWVLFIIGLVSTSSTYWWFYLKFKIGFQITGWKLKSRIFIYIRICIYGGRHLVLISARSSLKGRRFAVSEWLVLCNCFLL